MTLLGHQKTQNTVVARKRKNTTGINPKYLLTPRCRILLEKLTGLNLVKKFPTFYGTRRFITALTSVHHLSLSWASPIQSIYLHPTSCRSILILSTHLRLGLPSGLFPTGFPTKTLYTPLSSPICLLVLSMSGNFLCSQVSKACVFPSEIEATL